MPEASKDVSPKVRKAGLSAGVIIGLVVIVAVAVASFYYVLRADVSGPIAQGGENLVGAGSAQESYEAVTDEAPIVTQDDSQPPQTPQAQ